MICSFASVVVVEYTGNLASRFLSFQCDHDEHPYPVSHNHGARQPSDDYVRLNKVANFIEIRSLITKQQLKKRLNAF